MTDTYALGLREKNSSAILWVKVEAPSNNAAFTAFARALMRNHGDEFSVAGILADLKRDTQIVGIHIGNLPDSDHTPHFYDETQNTVNLLDLDNGGLVKYSPPLASWLGRYGFHAGLPVY